MDIRKVKKLIELLEETGINEIEIHEGDDSVRVSKGSSNQQYTIPQPMPLPTQPMVAPVTPTATAEAAPTTPTTVSGHEVKSPMVGTFYRSSSPDKPPFAEVGQKVEIGDTLCIVEAMKMFNEIESDKSGTIQACLVEDGQPVEYDQPLFVIE